MRRSMYMWSNTRSSPASCTVFAVSVCSSSSSSGANDALRKAHAPEFLRIHQPAGAVVLEHELVFRLHLLAQDVLRIRKPVADHLEHHVEGGQREAHHHQPAIAGRVHEDVRRVGQVPHQLADSAPSCPAWRGPSTVNSSLTGLRGSSDFRNTTASPTRSRSTWKYERVKPNTMLTSPSDEHHRIHQHAAIGVLERDDERNHEVPADDLADDVGARHLVEHRADDLDLLDARRSPLICRCSVISCGDVRDALVEILPGRAEGQVAEHVLEQQLQRAAVGVRVGVDVAT